MDERTAYRNINQSVLRHIQKALDQDDAADLESVLHKLTAGYNVLRQAAHGRYLKRKNAASEIRDNNGEATSRPSRFQPLASSSSPVNSPQEPWPKLSPLMDRTLSSLRCLPRRVLRPIAKSTCDLFQTDERSSEFSAAFLDRVFAGRLLWQGIARAVIQLSDSVVVKVAQSLDHDEHDILRFLETNFPSLPAPRTFGMVVVGHTSFMFMSVVQGTTLETRWPSLSAENKAEIRDTLDQQLVLIRQLELPPGEPLGCPVNQRTCKDVRYNVRTNTSPIYSEAEFNDFLVCTSSSRIAPGYKNWIRSLLGTEHRIVFTHADFHPRNIMVVDGPDGAVELSGIIDWEFSGFYPEYWEQLKALNTRSMTDTSDWWEHLPPSVLGYDRDVILDRFIELSGLLG
ncbi:kinase-like protein [Cubamyces menziesii]|nr:kinase-like protein [Cubamyces menziesii]